MTSQGERRRLLDAALALRLPEIGRRPGDRGPADTRLSGEGPEYRLEIPSPVRPESQHLTIALRADGDVQVEYHVAGKDGSPFEALFVMVDGEEREIVDEVAGFVADLIEERLVLARDSSWFRGGRRFLAPSAIGGEALRRLDWVTSWRGTHDWRL